jgi:hypothetical protein
MLSDSVVFSFASLLLVLSRDRLSQLITAESVSKGSYVHVINCLQRSESVQAFAVQHLST